jgi:mannose-6-phosphate isomerase-like protein (cupin superfamily)
MDAVMDIISLRSETDSIGKLEIVSQTTSEDAGAAMKILGDFNQCMVGIVYFSGATPWERHPDDEFLQILEGEVAVTILGDEVKEILLSVGSVFVVPRGLWHKQHSDRGVKLLFLTSQSGNEHSEATDPRMEIK